jgi:hypothetical protein
LIQLLYILQSHQSTSGKQLNVYSCNFIFSFA